MARRILLVEDDTVTQWTTQKILQRLGYEVDIAGNGQEAIEALRSKPYHLILMDYDMPVMDGIAATAFIRAAPSLSQFGAIPIIAISASGEETRRACLASGMDAFLTKPFKMEELESALELWLRPNPE